MKKKFRVKSERDFHTIFKQKMSKANKQFVIYYVKKEQSHHRVGLSVSKKLGNAVTRNRIKRKIRRAFHELEGYFKQNYDIIVIARQPVVDMTVAEIKSSLLHVARLAKIVEKTED